MGKLLKLPGLDQIFAVIGILASLAFIGLMYVKDKPVYIVLFSLVLIVCTLWLAGRNYILRDSRPTMKTYDRKIFLIAFVALFTADILVLYSREAVYERPLVFFVLTALIAGLIAFEILHTGPKNSRHILLQIILLGLLIMFSEQTLFPSLIGIDPSWHQKFTTEMLRDGHVPSYSAYSTMPLTHINVMTAMALSGLDYKSSLIFAVGVVQIICSVLFIYSICGFIVKDETTSLLATLFLTISNQYIMFNYWGIPNTFAAIFFILLIGMVVKLLIVNGNFNTYFAFNILIAALIFTHSVTSALFLMALTVIIGSKLIYKRLYGIRISGAEKNQVQLIMLFGILMFLLWSLSNIMMFNLSTKISAGMFTNTFAVSGPGDFRPLVVSFTEQLFNNLGFIVFFALSILGFLFLVSKKGDSRTFSYVFGGMLILVTGFIGMVANMGILSDRFWFISQILLSIPVAIAVMLVFRSRLARAGSFLIAAFVASFALVMILTPGANIDNHTFSPNSDTTTAFTQSELNGASFLADYYSGNLSSDFDYATNPSSSVFYNYYWGNLRSINSIDYQLFMKSFRNDDSIKVLRKTVIDQPFRSFNGIYRLDYDPNILLGNRYNKLYDSSSVTMFYYPQNESG